MFKHYISLALLSIATFNFVSAEPSASEASSKTEITSQASNNTQKEDISPQSKYQSIIAEYKQYLSTVDKKTRDEIISFRKEMSNINQKKKDLYKSLSQEAQLFLEKEKAVKRKLPINLKKQVSIQD